MPLIIDTYNVLHTVGVLPPELAAYSDVEGLVWMLGRGRYRNERIELVCDGSPEQPRPKGRTGSGIVPPSEVSSEAVADSVGPVPANMRIQYSGPGREADEVIATLVRHSTAPRSLTIVSSDAAVVRSARRRKCRTLSSAEFLEHLAADCAAGSGGLPPPTRKPPGGLTAEQIETWMQLFDVDEAAAAEEAEARQSGKPQSDATEAGDEPRSTPPPIEGLVIPDELIEEAERLLRERRDQ